eukprot:TRINITY_DN2332_c0_g1_i2.p1 TRINITY_DN2332_c0_g1~~TRINITY_DN2332_c0_g1_i2.p1  ORF type:complete len:376 (+),score=100.85 TRINITY_DN2332_c0_g1_i2:833-1960(+)
MQASATNTQYGAGTGGYSQDVPIYLNAFTLNQWGHLCGTYDGHNHLLYFNGALVMRAAMNTYNISATGNKAWIGSQVDSSLAQRWIGSLKDVRVYARALASAEVASLYALGVNGNTCAPPSGASLVGSPTVFSNNVLVTAGTTTTVGGTLNVPGSASFSGASTNVNGPFSVSGPSSFSAPTTFSAPVSLKSGVTGAVNFWGTVGINAGVAGLVTFNGAVTLSGGIAGNVPGVYSFYSATQTSWSQAYSSDGLAKNVIGATLTFTTTKTSLVTITTNGHINPSAATTCYVFTCVALNDVCYSIPPNPWPVGATGYWPGMHLNGGPGGSNYWIPISFSQQVILSAGTYVAWLRIQPSSCAGVTWICNATAVTAVACK